jgi:uncharacterized protein YeaO (DUF488 family)
MAATRRRQRPAPRLHRRPYSSPVCLAHEMPQGTHKSRKPASKAAPIRVKRVYDPPARGDGFRVLVDRLWPRGLKKAAVPLDAWAKEIAPSGELRKWFGHDRQKWQEFRARYKAELRDHEPELEGLRHRATQRPVTLLFATKDPEHNHAIVLKEVLDPG